MEKYAKIGDMDKQGRAMFKRERDGKTCLVKISWFKIDPAGSGSFIPRSRTKALRIANGDWE